MVVLIADSLIGTPTPIDDDNLIDSDWIAISSANYTLPILYLVVLSLKFVIGIIC